MTTVEFDLQPEQLTVMTTSECTAHCAHCSVRSGPRRADRLSREQLLASLDAVQRTSPLKQVIFAGGEPTLLGEDLLDALAHLDALGIGTRIVTNASWAGTPESAHEMVSSLREAGLQEINISTDEFHLPFIPIDNVRNAWEASKGQGFASVVIALSSGPGSQLRPADVWVALSEEPALLYDEAGVRRPLPPRSSDGTVYALANNDVYRIGRGRRLPLRHVRPTPLDALSMTCPWAVRSAALSPKGHLVACCGIEAEGNAVLDFGDAQTEPIETLVSRANGDTLVTAIAELGPLHLMRRAIELDPDLNFRTQYGAICEICEDVVTNPRAVEVLREDPALAVEVGGARLLRQLRTGLAAGIPR